MEEEDDGVIGLPPDPGSILLEFRMDELQRENTALVKRIEDLEQAVAVARAYHRKLNQVIRERMRMTGSREPSIEEIYREMWLNEIE
jgi:hypothetical protein